jgi:hypothetical protein
MSRIKHEFPVARTTGTEERKMRRDASCCTRNELHSIPNPQHLPATMKIPSVACANYLAAPSKNRDEAHGPEPCRPLIYPKLRAETRDHAQGRALSLHNHASGGEAQLETLTTQIGTRYHCAQQEATWCLPRHAAGFRMSISSLPSNVDNMRHRIAVCVPAAPGSPSDEVAPIDHTTFFQVALCSRDGLGPIPSHLINAISKRRRLQSTSTELSPAMLT